MARFEQFLLCLDVFKRHLLQMRQNAVYRWERVKENNLCNQYDYRLFYHSCTFVCSLIYSNKMFTLLQFRIVGKASEGPVILREHIF